MIGLDAFYIIAIILMGYSYYRMFSRKIYQRAAENQKFLQKEQIARTWLTRKKNALIQSKTHHIYKCPGCKQKIRVPKGRGKIEIRCSKCGTKFIKKSWRRCLMFGYIIVNKSEMKFKEFDVYHSYYCGLCRFLQLFFLTAGRVPFCYNTPPEFFFQPLPAEFFGRQILQFCSR